MYVVYTHYRTQYTYTYICQALSCIQEDARRRSLAMHLQGPKLGGVTVASVASVHKATGDCRPQEWTPPYAGRVSATQLAAVSQKKAGCYAFFPWAVHVWGEFASQPDWAHPQLKATWYPSSQDIMQPQHYAFWSWGVRHWRMMTLPCWQRPNMNSWVEVVYSRYSLWSWSLDDQSLAMQPRTLMCLRPFPNSWKNWSWTSAAAGSLRWGMPKIQEFVRGQQGYCPPNSRKITRWHPGSRMFWKAMGLNAMHGMYMFFVFIYCMFHLFLYLSISKCAHRTLPTIPSFEIRYTCALPIYKRRSAWQRVMASFICSNVDAENLGGQMQRDAIFSN